MMKFVFSIISIFIFSFASLSQDTGTIVGNLIAEETKEALPAVNISLYLTDSLIQTTTSDSNGEFSFKGLLEGVYQMKFVLDGYQTVMLVNIKIEAGQNIDLTDFSLSPPQTICGNPIRNIHPRFNNSPEAQGRTFSREELNELPYRK